MFNYLKSSMQVALSDIVTQIEDRKRVIMVPQTRYLGELNPMKSFG